MNRVIALLRAGRIVNHQPLKVLLERHTSNGEVVGKRATGGDLSPDGRWIAFVSNETGRNEVWVRAIPPQTEKHRASNGGGYMPRWRADGRELFDVEQPTSRLMAVSVKIGPRLDLSAPVALFERSYLLGPSYDVTPDGQRFLVRSHGDLANHITLVQNWTETVRKAESKSRE